MLTVIQGIRWHENDHDDAWLVCPWRTDAVAVCWEDERK